MLLFQYDDRAGGLRVESAGHMLDGVVDELLDAVVGDGGLVGELVEGTTLFGELQERFQVCHCG